jgi:Rrf2 family protein
MKITALEEYGLRCMLMFAEKGPETPLTITEISAGEGLSVPYTGKLLMILKQAGLVRAVRGRNGGYILARPPEEMILKDIFDALGEPFFGPHHCTRYAADNDVCVHNENCKVRDMWATFEQFIGGILGRLTLADLAAGNCDFAAISNPGSNPVNK